MTDSGRSGKGSRNQGARSSQADGLADSLPENGEDAFAAGDDFRCAPQAELYLAAKIATADFVGVELDANDVASREPGSGGAFRVLRRPGLCFGQLGIG